MVIGFRERQPTAHLAILLEQTSWAGSLPAIDQDQRRLFPNRLAKLQSRDVLSALV
jgi:hypothetical protein